MAMADKVSTLILKVDLDCDLCYKKIRRTLSKLQEKEKIQSIFYDEKSQTVTISGPFSPQKLTKKLCSSACSVIKDMQIKDNNKPKETKPPTGDKPKPGEPAKDKPKSDVKPAEAKIDNKPTDNKPKDAKPAEAKTDKPTDDTKPAEAKTDKPTDDKPKGAKPAEVKLAKPDDKPNADAKPTEVKNDKPEDAKPAEVKGDNPKDANLPVEVMKNAYIGQAVEFGQSGYQPAWSTGGPGCYCSPWGYYGDYKGCSCGTQRGYGGGGPAYGWAPEGQPVVVYGGPSYGYQQSYQTMGPPPVVYGGPAYEVGYQYQTTTNKFFCEEDEDPQASCSIM